MSSRPYTKSDRDMLADELVDLLCAWENARWWWQRWAIKHVLFVKVKYRISTISGALRGQ